MNLEEGKCLVHLARKALFSDVKLEGKFIEKLGVFVTLHSYPSGDLRGCIGFIEPVYILEQGVIEAAKSAAFSDPRFPPLTKDEEFVIEVSVLTKPELIEKPYETNIEIGKDGLIVEHHGISGLLLPIVAIDQKWDVKEFLESTCRKAGFPPDVLTKPDCKVYKFSTIVFSEKTPSGEVVKKM
jgi:uncharacterized protein